MVAVVMCSAVVSGWAQPLPLAPSTWDIRYSDGPVHPSAAPEGGWEIKFTSGAATPNPTQDCNCQGIGYVTTNWNKPIAGSSITISFEIAVTLGTEFGFKTERDNTCALPANFRLLIERKNDALTEPSYRWWSNQINYPLQNTNGLVSLTVPLSGDNWSDVYGVTWRGRSRRFYRCSRGCWSGRNDIRRRLFLRPWRLHHIGGCDIRAEKLRHQSVRCITQDRRGRKLPTGASIAATTTNVGLNVESPPSLSRQCRRPSYLRCQAAFHYSLLPRAPGIPSPCAAVPHSPIRFWLRAPA